MFVLALSGGSTPRRLYELLGGEEYRQRCNWNKVHIFQVDERFVPHTHRDSNFRFLNEALFVPASVPRSNIHPVRTTVVSVSDSASLYEDEIRIFFHPLPDAVPVFDCVVLGIGEDGHTASLFPGGISHEETGQFVLPVEDARYMHPRITFSLPVLNHAENIIFLAIGKTKASIVKTVIRKEDRSLPASLVHPAHDNLYFFLDNGAASLLTG